MEMAILWTIVIAYMIFIFFKGVSKVKEIETTDDFLVAGRSVTWPAVRPGCARRSASTGRRTAWTYATPVLACGRCRRRQARCRPARSPAGHGSGYVAARMSSGGSGSRGTRPSRRTGRMCRGGVRRQGARGGPQGGARAAVLSRTAAPEGGSMHR